MADDGIQHGQSSVIGRSGNIYSRSCFIQAEAFVAGGFSMSLPERLPFIPLFAPLYFSLYIVRMGVFSFARRPFHRRMGFGRCECRRSYLFPPF